VVYVSWLDANAYARWIGKHLPAEEEWEKAARGSNGYQWPWGDRFYPYRANVRENRKNGPMPVGSFPNGANEFGVLDLAGNVWEWVDSDLKPYPGYDESLFYFEKGYRKVYRGGSFKETGDYARGAFRGDGAVDQIYYNVGFRCANDVPGQREKLVIENDNPEGTLKHTSGYNK
jgi:iron(II)-dependent oxidoreductase